MGQNQLQNSTIHIHIIWQINVIKVKKIWYPFVPVFVIVNNKCKICIAHTHTPKEYVLIAQEQEMVNIQEKE